MSLINKMLQDLEARQGGGSNSRPAYQGLRPVPRARIRSRRRALGVVLVSLVLGAPAGFYVRASLRPSGSAEVQSALARAQTPSPAEIRAEPASETKPVGAPTLEAQAMAPPDTGSAAPANDGAPADELGSSAEESPVASSSANEDVVGEQSASPAPAEVAVAEAALKPERRTEPAKPQPARRLSVARADRPKAAVFPLSPAVSGEPLDKKIRPLSPRETAEDQYRRAARLLEQGRSEEARSAARAAVAADAGHHAARELLVGLELQQGRSHEAAELLEAGLQISPQHYPFAQLLARVHVEHGADGQALGVLEAAAPHAARDPDFLSFLAALYQRAGRHAEAAQTYRQAVGLRETDGRAWLGLAISLEAQSEREAARDAYRRARTVGGLALALDRYATQRLAALE